MSQKVQPFFTQQINPECRAFVDEVNQIRGAFIACYGQMEFVLGDLFYRCTRKPDYEYLSTPISFSLKRRISAVKRLLEAGGFLDDYRQDLDLSIDHIWTFERFRHLMAHGQSQIDIGRQPWLVVLRTYDFGAEGPPSLVFEEYTLEELRGKLARAVTYAGTMTDLFRRIYLENDLEASDL